MESTLQQLGRLLLSALPTFFLVVLLTFYLKAFFFNPLGKVLKQRYDATLGARQVAAKAMERAAARTAEYEGRIRAARAEVYQGQEQLHRQLQEQESRQMAEARRRAEAAIAEAKKALAGDVETAKSSLDRDSEALANQIADSMLRRSAA